MTELKRLRLSEGFTIALLTLLGYALAFAYEYGAMHRYGVPVYLIRVDITYIVISLAALASIVMSVLNTAWLVPAKPWHILIYLLWMPAFAVWFAALLLLHTRWVSGRHLVFPLLVGGTLLLLSAYTILADVIAPIVVRTDLPTWWDRWQARARGSVQHDKSDVLEVITKADTTGGLFMFRVGLFGVAMICLVVQFSAKWHAALTQNFLVASRTPPCIVVRRYAENLVCVDIDSAAHRVLGGIHLLPLGDTGLVLSPRRLGVLRTPSDSADAAYWFEPPPVLPAPARQLPPGQAK